MLPSDRWVLYLLNPQTTEQPPLHCLSLHINAPSSNSGLKDQATFSWLRIQPSPLFHPASFWTTHESTKPQDFRRCQAIVPLFNVHVFLMQSTIIGVIYMNVSISGKNVLYSKIWKFSANQSHMTVYKFMRSFVGLWMMYEKLIHNACRYWNPRNKMTLQ